MNRDTELLDWMTTHGASIVMGSQPDMGGRDWSISLGHFRVKERFRSPREAIEAAIVRYAEYEAIMSAGVDLCCNAAIADCGTE
jgi:hypothetical protein